MTSPGDDGAEEALRRALSEAARGIEPGADGLERIRARIGGRPPRPWPIAVGAGVVDRVRHWTWRGHWDWRGRWDWRSTLARLGAPRERRSRRGGFPWRSVGWLRLVTVVGAVAILAGVGLGVQPVRQAILQASASLNGFGGTSRGSAGTEGHGSPASAGDGSPAAGRPSASPSGGIGTVSSGSSGHPSGAAHPTATNACVYGTPTLTAAPTPSQTSAAASAPSTVPAIAV
ncbi:MAG: hypothetical protein ACRDNS_17365, partial [Trebonia sp.]